MAKTVQAIHECLEESMKPSYLRVIDESDQHIGHPEAIKSGGGHFKLLIASDQFEGLRSIERHRLVFDHLKPFFGEKIHALSIIATTNPQSLYDQK